MIYFVSGKQSLIDDSRIKHISVDESLKILDSWKLIQYDSETSGLDPHVNELLTAQFGNQEGTDQIVVDCTTISIVKYKDILESKPLVGANLKFDCKFLFNYNIVPKILFDVIIIEQLLYLSYPKGKLLFNLQAIADRYLKIHLDKSVRSKIPELGISYDVIEYGANDVKYLYQILRRQINVLKEKDMLKAARVECNFVLCCAYYEWCGVKLDVDKWQNNIWEYEEAVKSTEAKLNQFVVDLGNKDFLIYRYPDLFGFEEPGYRCNINWKSSKQVLPLLQFLGFDTKHYDKKDKKYKHTASSKVVAKQTGINDEFLKLYVDYIESNKLLSTYGYSYINAINPKTKRIHTEFRQLGTDTGRLACGSQLINKDLAHLKGLPLRKSDKEPDKVCSYPNVQVLPRTTNVRSAFICDKDNVIISSDYSSEESRFLAHLSQDKEMLYEYGPEGGSDFHSLVARMVYPQLRGLSSAEIKKNYKELRQKAKNPEFCFAYGGDWHTLVSEYGMDPKEAQEIDNNYREGFKGVTEFQNKCKAFTAKFGYIPICEELGYKSYVYGWETWNKNQTSSTFWETYRYYKDNNLEIPKVYSDHFRFKSQMDKNAVNSRLQGLGAVCFKIFNYRLFDWIVDEGYFGKVRFCVPAHDEIVVESPKNIKDIVVEKLEYFMQSTAEHFCSSLPCPVETEVGDYWIH